MHKKHRVGYADQVGTGRAKPNRPADEIDLDPCRMVQEQIARLKFFAEKVDFQAKSVLDLGCGTGFNCEYVIRKLGAKRALGVDISESTIAFAKKTYQVAEYIVGDVSDPTLNLGLESWNYVLCCEVIEHVEKPLEILDTIHRHLYEDGVAFISTPNNPVFSLGIEPSLSQTHLKEYCLDEYRKMLESKFSQVNIWGQRFTSERLFRMHQNILRRSIADLKFLGGLYWNPPIRRMWKVLRLEMIRRWLEGSFKYNHSDFEFVEPVSHDSIWLCAVVKKCPL